jgi:hypothetical protein
MEQNQAIQQAWQVLKNQYQLNELQLLQFKNYLKLLLEENEKYNLTAIVQVDSVIADHFFDSLALLKLYDVSKVQTIVDVGSGAGFPGIPLAVCMPQTQFCLIEVSLKKVHFLNLVIQALDLKNVVVCSQDWRTFLRSEIDFSIHPACVKTTAGTRNERDVGMDKTLPLLVIPGFERESKSLKDMLVIARASLQVDELLKVFKPSSKFKDATLVYWASKKWVPTLQEKEYLVSCVEYAVGQKQRNLCFFKNK